MAVAKSIRISGAHCLGPVELKKAIEDVPIGGLLEVVTNDVCAKEDIPTWCRFTKNELVEFQELDAVCDKTDPVTCALVLSDNPQAVEVLRLFKPNRVFLAYEGRKLLEALKEFNVAVCTYFPFDVPSGVKTTDLPILLEMCYGEPVLVL